ncbi:hypothetical protein V5799_002584 [Amblyomma americanum]|uniref:Uncharacterized protein n=1 Tax=Amblyomma americanum TaxID=6943 RepID=A0AAQ4CWX5_AMBAM
MEDSSEARPNAAESKEQQTVPKGSRQAQGRSGPAVAEPTRQKQVTRRKKNRSKHQRRKRTPSVRTATTADSSCFLKPTEKAKSQPRKGEKQARSVTDVVGDNEHADPTTSGSQVPATVLGGLQTGLDESRCPPSVTPPQVAPVLSPPSTSFYVVGGALKDSDKEPSGAFLSPGQPLVPWLPATAASNRCLTEIMAFTHSNETWNFAGTDNLRLFVISLHPTPNTADTADPLPLTPYCHLWFAVGVATFREISALTETLLHYKDLTFWLAILAIAGGFAGIVVLLFFAGGKVRYGPRLGECASESCKRASRDLDLLIDPGVDPCRDFYGHVCSRWVQKTARSGGSPVSFLRYGTRELTRRINNTLSGTNETKPASLALYKVAMFYQSCERFVGNTGTASMSEALLPFRQYSNELLNVESFADVVRYIVQLSLARGVHTVLDIRLKRFPDGVFLRLLRGHTLSRKMDAKPALSLKNYLEQLMDDGVSGMLGRHINVSAILEIERSLRDYMIRESREQRQSISILEVLNADMRLDEWLDAINVHLPLQYKLNSQSVLSAESVDLIQQLLSFFKDLVDFGVDYIYVQILLDAFRFDYLRRVSSNDSEQVVSSCLRATQLVMRNTRDIIASHLFPEQSGDGAVDPIFSEVLESVSVPSTFSWMRTLMKVTAEKTLQNIFLHQFSVYSQTPFDEADLTTASKTSSFPGFFLQMKKRQQLSLLEDPPAPQAIEIDDAFLLSSDVFYDDHSNSIVVPASVRQEPILYAEDVPPEYVMGSLGILIARALLRAVVPTNASSLWSSEERLALSHFNECMDGLERTAFNVSIDRHDSRDPREVYVWTQSARSAFNALKAAYEPSRTAVNYGIHWVSAQKTFFRRFCLLSCNVRSQQQRLASRALCMLPLINMEEFSKTFDCPYHPAAYSSDQCEGGLVNNTAFMQKTVALLNTIRDPHASWLSLLRWKDQLPLRRKPS